MYVLRFLSRLDPYKKYVFLSDESTLLSVCSHIKFSDNIIRGSTVRLFLNVFSDALTTHPVEAEGGDGVLFLVYDPHGAVHLVVARARVRPLVRRALRRRGRGLRAPPGEHRSDEYLLRAHIDTRCYLLYDSHSTLYKRYF